jgi:hypothetical protein
MAEHRNNRFESGSSSSIIVRRRFVDCDLFHPLHGNH